MIIVKINLTVLAEKQKELLQTLISLIEPVKKEKGCSSYALFCEITDKNSFCIMEEWTNQKDLNHHLKSFRFGVLLGTKPLLLKPPIIQIHTPNDIQGMAFVEAVRAKEKE
ncbi:antibiotic biosynthesis monooxygenase [uncultured Desulfobacter sp.]|uniref:putative quinol monooxygenase n=1 Tax=uncultured Desulfobacter sp. TaxID=240139 RepID=UPI0029C60574|nr:antibiotic biosynthesis monooxygenase [uncultured Desulfobacter sp.]